MCSLQHSPVLQKNNAATCVTTRSEPRGKRKGRGNCFRMHLLSPIYPKHSHMYKPKLLDSYFHLVLLFLPYQVFNVQSLFHTLTRLNSGRPPSEVLRGQWRPYWTGQVCTDWLSPHHNHMHVFLRGTQRTLSRQPRADPATERSRVHTLGWLFIPTRRLLGFWLPGNANGFSRTDMRPHQHFSLLPAQPPQVSGALLPELCKVHSIPASPGPQSSHPRERAQAGR